MTNRTCTVDGCDRHPTRKALCPKHYQRVRRYGTTELPPSRTKEDLFWEKVRKTDECWEWTGYTSPNGYGMFGHKERSVYPHRLSYEMHNGPIPEGMQVDHICHNRSCSRPSHLRLATVRQNGEYRRGPAANNKSTGVRNVARLQRKSGFVYRVTVCRKYIGIYDTLEEADAVAKRVRAETFDFPDF